MAKIKLDEITKPDYSDCLGDKSDEKTNSYIAKIDSGALTDNADYMDAILNVGTNSYIVQNEWNVLTEIDYIACFGANLVLETNGYRAKINFECNGKIR